MRDWEQIEPKRRALADFLSARIDELGYTSESFADQLNTTAEIVIEIRSGYLDLPVQWATTVAGALRLDAHELMTRVLEVYLPTLVYSAAEAIQGSVSPDEMEIIRIIRKYNGAESSPISNPHVLDGIRRIFTAPVEDGAD